MQNGVKSYRRATVDIFFEPDHIACAFCPLLDTDKRYFCRRTGELIIDAKTLIGNYCPLQFEQEENNA